MTLFLYRNDIEYDGERILKKKKKIIYPVGTLKFTRAGGQETLCSGTALQVPCLTDHVGRSIVTRHTPRRGV